MSEQKRLVIKLEKNAMDSLVHGIEHHLYGKRESDLKYVVLHVFHAVELFLKARLAKHDEKLIYRNRKDNFTVDCDEAISRLISEVNIPLGSYAEEPSKSRKTEYILAGELAELREARNNIEHKEAYLNKGTVNSILGVTFRFLDDFVSRELGLSLSDELEALDDVRWDEMVEAGLAEEDIPDQDSYQTLSLAYLSYLKSMSDRGISLNPKDRVDYSFFTCEMCNQEAVIFPDPRSFSSITYCYNCRAQYEVYTCAKCEQDYLEFLGEWQKSDSPPDHPDLKSLSTSEDPDISFCENCLENI